VVLGEARGGWRGGGERAGDAGEVVTVRKQRGHNVG
jgi:hypothetical protein